MLKEEEKKTKRIFNDHRILLNKLSTLSDSLLARHLVNTFQNLKVSSPAPVTIDSPSGETAKYKTRNVCPVKRANCSIDGYFQTTI